MRLGLFEWISMAYVFSALILGLGVTLHSLVSEHLPKKWKIR